MYILFFQIWPLKDCCRGLFSYFFIEMKQRKGYPSILIFSYVTNFTNIICWNPLFPLYILWPEEQGITSLSYLRCLICGWNTPSSGREVAVSLDMQVSVHHWHDPSVPACGNLSARQDHLPTRNNAPIHMVTVNIAHQSFSWIQLQLHLASYICFLSPSVVSANKKES